MAIHLIPALTSLGITGLTGILCTVPLVKSLVRR